MKATQYRGIVVSIETKRGGGYICSAQYKNHTMIGFTNDSTVYDDMSESSTKKAQNRAARSVYFYAKQGKKLKNE